MSNIEDKIHVTVSGPMNSGKTTIARVIADALRRAGFEGVVNLDRDAKNRNQGFFPVDAERLRRFAEGRKVTIITANVNRQALQRSARAASQDGSKKVNEGPT